MMSLGCPISNRIQNLISNRVWLTKMQEGLVLPKGLPVKKVMYAIFFTPNGQAIQVSMPKGKSMKTMFYKIKVHRKFSNSTRNVDRR